MGALWGCMGMGEPWGVTKGGGGVGRMAVHRGH